MPFKKRVLSCALALLAITVSGTAWSQESLYKTGKLPLPGYPGYSVVMLAAERPAIIGKSYHYLYFIEKDEVPVAGISSSYMHGKTPVNVATEVGSSLTQKINCSTISECKQFLQLRKEQALLQEVQDCLTVKECDQALAKLQDISKASKAVTP